LAEALARQFGRAYENFSRYLMKTSYSLYTSTYLISIYAIHTIGSTPYLTDGISDGIKY
jgi:hypothetical protein